MIKKRLNILLVEDSENDEVLIKRQISKIVENPVIQVTDNLKGCKDLLVNFAPDVVLSDYNMPTCTGLDVLKLVKDFDPEIAFIFITGTINDEELAANTILNGASGYILKKHMNQLGERLKPLLNQVVANMIARDELRDIVRKNRIAANRIYDYLEKITNDNKEHLDSVKNIKQAMQRFGVNNNDATES